MAAADIDGRIREALKGAPQGKNITQLHRDLKIHRNTLSRYLERLLISGQVEVRRFGMEKIYTLSQRVPLAEVLSISSEYILQLDKNLRIVFANEPFSRLVGAGSGDLIGKNIEYTPVPLVFDDSYPGFIGQIQQGISGERWSGEIRLGGTGMLLSCRITPTVFDDGRQGASVICTDITGSRMADQDLHESEDRYRKLVEISPDAVIIHKEGTITYLNPAACRLLGTSNPEAILGRNLLDFIDPGYRSRVLENISRDLRGVPSPPMEVVMTRLDGSAVIVEGRGVRTFIGGEFAVQVALRNITEEKRAQEAIRRKDRQLSSLFGNVPEVLFYLSIEPNDRYRFLAVNQAFLDRMHTTEEKVVGRYVDEVVPDPLYYRSRAMYHRAIKERRRVTWEETQETPEGTRYGDCSITAVFDEEGHPSNIIGSVHDSTQHRLIEKELTESERRLRLILDSTDDLIVMQDPDGRYLYFNSAERYGISNTDMFGASPFDILDRKTAERLVNRVKEVIRTGITFREESALVWQGQTLWFSDTLSPVRDGSSRIMAVVTISQNITERKQAEIALQESEATLRALINTPTDSVLLMDTRGIVLTVNETAASRLGLPPGEIVGCLADDLLPAEVARSRRRIVSRVLETKAMVRFEDGRDGRWYDNVAFPILNEAGEVFRIALTARDITDRRMADETFHRQERRLQSILQATGDLIWETDADARFVYLSPQAEEILGCRPEDLIGHTPFGYLDPDAVSADQEAYRQAAQEGRAVLHTSFWRRPDGSGVDLISHAIPQFDRDGRFAGFIGIARRREAAVQAPRDGDQHDGTHRRRKTK